MQKYKNVLDDMHKKKRLAILSTNYYYIRQVMNAQLSETVLLNRLSGNTTFFPLCFFSFYLLPLVIALYTQQ